MTSTDNIFLHGSLGRLFVRTAAPIILIMTINGLYVVADAYFLGIYVGADALSAVTLIFPMMMMLYALQTLVSNGMASILARELGAGRRQEARQTFTGAHVLVIGVVIVLYALYWSFGRMLIEIGASGAPAVAANAELFMTITVSFVPIAFFLSLNIDALRCEGRLGFMTLVTISATLSLIVVRLVRLSSRLSCPSSRSISSRTRATSRSAVSTWSRSPVRSSWILSSRFSVSRLFLIRAARS